MLIATAQDAIDLFEPCFAGIEGEALAIAHLDEGRRLIELAVIDPAAISEAELPLREILSEALRLGAVGLLLAHNHPSGDAQPSWDDVEATRELAETAARLGIRLHDHLIFADGERCSLRGLGLL